MADINGDGKNDVNALVWYRNGDWRRHEVDRVKLHDVEVADLDSDGKLDIVARNQSGAVRACR